MMSSVPDFMIRNSLRMASAVQWYVDVPKGIEHRSSVFVLQGRKMFFRFSNYKFGISVELVHEGRYEEKLRPFSVSVFAHLLDKDESVNRLKVCNCKVLETPVNIWKYEWSADVISAMERKLMRFTFLFDKDSGLASFKDPEIGTKHGLSDDDSTLLQNNLENLSVDFGKMLETSAHADVQIHCDGGVAHAHRAILASRSKVFDRMKESRSGIIKMVGAKIETVKVFLQFIYTGKIGNPSVDMAYCLYTLADKYDVSTLKNLCSDLMAKHVSKKNRK